MEKLVVSIVTWNSEQTISACVESLLHQTYQDFKIIIVDNNSLDKTCEIIEHFADDRIHLNRRKENTGFCGGHNFSITNSSSEYILLVNPDVILYPDYIEKAIRRIESDARVGTVCGLLLQSEASDPNCVIDSAGLELKRSGVMRLKHHGKKISESRLELEKVFGADGALPLYRRLMTEDISYNGEFFDEMFFAHKEDWDVSWRAQIYGWNTLFDPSCIAIHPRHFKPKSLKVRSNISDEIKIHSVKNQLILLLKNEKASSFLLNCVFIIPRQLLIYMYILLFEQKSLKAYQFVYRNYKRIKAKRKVIQSRRVR